MKAIVLAAGKSTRLYPLTLSTPKCLLPIGGKAIVDHQIESLIEAGIMGLVIVVGCYKQQIIDHLAEKNYPIEITYIENDKYETTHPITSLQFAREHIVGPIIFFHCDVLFTPDAIKRLLADIHESTLLCREGLWDEEAGKIIVDAEGRVRELGKHIEKDRATGEYLQVAKFGTDFCKRLVAVLEERTSTGRDGYTIDAFNDVIQDDSILAFGLPFTGVAMEIDTIEDYEAAKKAWGEKDI